MDGISNIATVAKTSDAELIRLCAEHIANRDAFNEAGLNSEGAGKALWETYMQTYNAISDAEPQTFAGLAAKARATKAEATHPDGTVMPEDEVQWAFDLVEDLIRLDEQNLDAELIRLGGLLAEARKLEDAAFVAARNFEDDTPEGRAADAAYDATGEIVDQIEAATAHTPAGLVVKLEAFFWCRCDEDLGEDATTDQRVMAGLRRDLKAMGGAA